MEVCAPFHDTGSKKQESRPSRRLNFSYRTIKSPVLLDFLVGQHCINIDVCFWRRRRDSNSRDGFPSYALSRGASSTKLEYFSLDYLKNFYKIKMEEREGFEAGWPAANLCP